MALGLLVASGSVQLWMVWLLALLMGTINAIDAPARQSFVVEMVGPEALTNAVGLNSVIVKASRMVGPAITGVLIVMVGMPWTFLLNAASFLAVLGALWAMRPADLCPVPRIPRAKGQIRAGIHYAWAAWELRIPLLIRAVISALAYNFTVTMPLLAQLFHRGADTYSALTTAMGVGALIGALSAAARRRPSYRQLVLIALAFGVCLVAVAWAPSLPVMMLLLAPLGGASVFFMVTVNSLLQPNSNSSDAMRGRVMALWAMVFLGSTPLGAPLTGFIAAQYGVRFALALGGGATVLTAVAAGLALRRIRAARGVAAASRETTYGHALGTGRVGPPELAYAEADARP